MESQVTYGQKQVGIGFNPARNADVQKIKEAYAAIIDLHHEAALSASSPEQKHFYEQAIDNAVTAQMLAVKAATWTMANVDDQKAPEADAQPQKVEDQTPEKTADPETPAGSENTEGK